MAGYGLYLLAAFYVFAGISHFINPKFYAIITPRWVPYPKIINLVIGSIELVLGLSVLYPATRSISLIGIILLLIAVFPANIRHYNLARKKGKPTSLLMLRLPLQALLIYWAYSYL